MPIIFTRRPLRKQNETNPDIGPIDPYDLASTEPEWQAIHVAADSRIARVEREFIGAVDQIRNQADQSRIIEAMQAATIEDALRMSDEAVDLQLFAVQMAPVVEVMREIMRDTVMSTAIRESRRLGVSLRFDIENPFSVKYIEEHGAKLVREVTEETRQAIRNIVKEAFEQGGSPYEQARRIRDVIGLTERQSNAVLNYRRGLIERGVHPDLADEMAGKYSNRLLNHRARVLARNETLDAANAGQYAQWQSMAEEGLLDTERTRLRWIVTPDDRLCTYCRAYAFDFNGNERTTTTRLNEPFPTRKPVPTKKTPKPPKSTPYETPMRPPLHVQCYSDDTEVLTDRGWMLFNELTGKEQVWTINLDTHHMELDRPIREINYRYKGKMIHFNNHSLDALVTPNHQMVIQTDWKAKYNKNAPYELRRADNIKDGDLVPRTANWSGEELKKIKIGQRKFDAKLFMRFLGWYIAEGSISKPPRGRWQIKITQEKTHEHKAVAELASTLFPTIWDGVDAVYIPHVEDLVPFFLSLGKAHEKHVPKQFKNLSPELLNAFLMAYIGGDGSVSESAWEGHPEWEFRPSINAGTSSKKLADDLAEIALKVGYRPYMAKHPPKTSVHWNGEYTSNHDLHRIHFRYSRGSHIRPRRDVHQVDYDGHVYCLEMSKNPTLYVRRNGQALWSGNCRCSLALEFLP